MIQRRLFWKKSFKICTAAFVSACLYSNVVLAQSHTITLEKKEITLNEFLSDIRKQTGYDFVFTSSKLNFNKKVSPKFKNAQLHQVLSQYFNVNTGVIYIVKNKTIVLIDEDKAAYKTIQGLVIDEVTKQPITGATVSFEDKNIKTTTNSQGIFVLNIPEYAKELAVKCLGHNASYIQVTEQSKYTIELEEKTEAIDDVVVTGLYKRSSDSFTGAATTISGEDIKKINNNSILAAIGAVDPAFRLMANNTAGSNINQMPEVRMRGENSFPNLTGELSNSPNEPLFILDGFQVPLQRVVDLDMNLIQSITLLKDASATAIYGSRGANGVMVINTIPPAAGKIQVTFNNDFRIATPELSVYNLLNATEKLDFEKRVGIYNGSSPVQQYGLDLLYNQRYQNVLEGVNTNWLKVPTQIGTSNRSSLRLQGGDHIIKYGLQFTADLQQGVMKGQDRNNYSGQLDLSYTTDKLRFMNSIRVFGNKSNESPYGSFSNYVSANPYHSPYDREGNIQYYLENLSYSSSYAAYRTLNPLYNTTLHSINSAGYFGVTNNLSVRYNVLPYLFVESNLSLTKQADDAAEFYSAQNTRFANYTDINRKGSYKATDGDSFLYESITTANLNLQRGKNQFFSTLGFNFASDKNQYYTITAEGFPYDRLDNLLFATQYQANSRPTGDENTYRRVGFLYNGNYSYDNRFLADVSIRRDGSSQYGTDKRFGTFWSAGLGWNIHNENFIKNTAAVNKLRLRGNYGSTGSLNIPAYSAMTRYTFGTMSSYYNELGATMNNLGNPILSWQSVFKFNVGLDATLFNEKLDIRVDAYKENTKDALTQVTLAPSTGFSDYPENLGEVENKGFEFSTRYMIINRKQDRVMWSVNVNGFTNSNILKRISNKLKSANDDLNASNPSQIYPNLLLNEGASMNTIYAVRSLGIDPITGSEIFLDKEGNTTFVWNAADKVAVGINQPKWNGNFGTNLIYKGWEFNMIFNYQVGGQIYNQTLVNRVENVDPTQNVDRRAYDLGWQGPGDISQFKRIQASVVTTNATSRFVQDDNNLKLSSASVGYNFFGKRFLKRMGLNSLAVSALTNDVIWLSSVQVERGTSNPFARNYSLSIRTNF